jgi:heme exporter protein A
MSRVPAGPPAPALAFEQVTVTEASKHYGRRRALARASLTCRTGEILGLFGPNGAGKSTLLGILSTLVRASGGDVRYGDRSAVEWGDRLRAQIGVLGHDLFLYGDLTVVENLEFFARLYDVPDRARVVASALEAGRLAARAGDRVSVLSRGLRQRLALERALLHGPTLVLLDEPFTGLDDESSSLLAARMRTLRDAGAIVVMATHDFDVADGLVDRGLSVIEGRVAPIPDGGEPLRARYRRAVREAETLR